MPQFLKNYYSGLDKWQKGAYVCYGVFFVSVLLQGVTYKWFYTAGPYDTPPTYWDVFLRRGSLLTLLGGITGIFCFFKSIFRKTDWGLIILTLLMFATVGLILWFFLTPTWQEVLQ